MSRSRVLPRIQVAAALGVLLALASTAYAHDRTTSYSSWYLSEREAKVVLRMSEVDVASLPWAADDTSGFDATLARYAVENLVLRAGGQACEVLGPPRRRTAPVGRLTLEWHVACPTEGALSIHSDLLLETRSSHLHFASLHQATDSADRVLSNNERTWYLGGEGDAARPTGSSMSMMSYWFLGIEHIATGYDHLVFLFALLLMGGTFVSLVKFVSGFTVGHSITLGLASLGFVRPDIAPIEALIGLSIALVAVENVWLLGSRSYLLPMSLVGILVLMAVASTYGLGLISSLSFLGFGLFVACYYSLLRRDPQIESARWAVSLIFGLIHGFGFASVLQAADLPAQRLPGVLLCFNLGVETGQILIIAMIWPLLCFALSRWGSLVVEIGSATTLGLGAYWFVERTYA